jgi:hypothetical protein
VVKVEGIESKMSTSEDVKDFEKVRKIIHYFCCFLVVVDFQKGLA